MAAVRGDGRLVGRARLHRERREVQARRPALRPGGQLLDVGRRQLDAAAAEQLGGLLRIERQVARRRARRGDRAPASCGAGQRGGAREATSRRCCAGSCSAIWVTMSNASGFVTASAWSMARVNGSRSSVDPREQPGHHRVDGPTGVESLRPPRAEGCRSGRGRPPRRRAAPRGRCRARRAVTHAARGAGALDPLREQRRLAVPGGRGDRDDRRFDGRDPVEEAGAARRSRVAGAAGGAWSPGGRSRDALTVCHDGERGERTAARGLHPRRQEPIVTDPGAESPVAGDGRPTLIASYRRPDCGRRPAQSDRRVRWRQGARLASSSALSR